LKQAGHEVYGCNPNNIVGYANAYLMLQDTLSKKIAEVKPGLIGLGGLCIDYKFLKDAIGIIRQIDPKLPIVLGGQIVTNDAEFIFNDLKPDYAVEGEGEQPLAALARDGADFVPANVWYRQGNGSPTKNEATYSYPPIDDLSFPDYSPFGIEEMLDEYSMATRVLYRYSRSEPRPFNIVASRGCPFACLSGGTLIDTLDGFIPIKELVGRVGIKVLTQNPLTNDLIYANAFNISKTRANATLVRVSFDDGSFIDCTPDHRFMAFKNGNQFVERSDREVEAKDLQIGQSIRAVKYRIHPSYGYVEVEYGRRYRRKQHRLIMAGFLERELSDGEVVHHKNGNKLNNSIGNLELTDRHNHCSFHPEVSKRMRAHNPMRNKEIRARQSATLKETIRSGNFVPFMLTKEGRDTISRIARVRASSDKNPLLKQNRREAWTNHKVISVTSLSPQKEDVYCMEVPGYDWFFANGVLVHNCSFCIDHHRSYRARSIENIMDEIKVSYERYKFNILILLDELFAVSRGRLNEFSQAILKGKKQYGWDFDWCFQTHASAKFDLASLQLAKRAGCYMFSYGLESASPTVLKSMDKRIKIEQVKEAIEMAESAGIAFSANLIFGDVAETQDTIAESLAFWFEYGRRCCIFLAEVKPYPGSALFVECLKRGLITDKKSYYETIDTVPINMTAMDDRTYAAMMSLLAQLEQGWLFPQRALDVHYEVEPNHRGKYQTYTGGDYYTITGRCPYCGEESQYQQLMPGLPFMMGLSCLKCQRKIKVEVEVS